MRFLFRPFPFLPMDPRTPTASALAQLSTPEAQSQGAPTIGPFLATTRIAHFSMEMVLGKGMQTYSGGLGVLAGDTARAAADLELPIVFVTLVSRAGYMRQSISADGTQSADPDPWRPEEHVTPLRAKVAVMIEGHEVWVRPWLHLQRGSLGGVVPVLLLDTDVAENLPEDRHITDALYGGGDDVRLKQEAVLGIGGVRSLQALGFNIRTYHLNEGHASLLALDLLRRHPRPVDQVKPGALAFDVAPVRGACVFTTHTPVEAGHDRFDYALFERVLPGYIDLEQLRLLAGSDRLNMTQLALNLSGFINGVAVRHAETTTRMFPGYEIHSITNGVHVPTWAHRGFQALFDARNPEWRFDPEVMFAFDQFSDEQIWRAHQQAKVDLVELVALRTGVRLDPDRPILGFARRMTAYKRPDLLFGDLERLRRIHQRHPFQLVFAGKAHPRDGTGHALIQQVHAHLATLAPQVRAAFLPGYDVETAKVLVAGADVWLNTPVPPLEASGTSGMKAAVNGVLNLSVLDGWWVEGCIEGVTGWAVGNGGANAAAATAEHLHEKLDGAVLPLWYSNRAQWIWMMKQSISRIGSYFNSHRMMRRYATGAYLPRGP
jgi:starch phosphorylase